MDGMDGMHEMGDGMISQDSMGDAMTFLVRSTSEPAYSHPLAARATLVTASKKLCTTRQTKEDGTPYPAHELVSDVLCFLSRFLGITTTI